MTEKMPPRAGSGDEEVGKENTNSPSRRRFIKLGVAGASTATWLRPASATPPPIVVPDTERVAEVPAGEHRVTLHVNGQQHALNLPANAILLDVLRDRLHLTGTKKGCDHGQCGACTVHVNGEAVNACLSVAVQHDGDSITTIEGLESNGVLSPLQEAFWEHDAYQCGYCTSGQMMSAAALLRNPNIAADDASVREAMSGNICRCAAYKNILAAIQSARVKMKEIG